MTRLLTLALLVTLLASACAPTAPVTRPEAPVDERAEALEALTRDGRYAEAAAGWLARAAEHPAMAATATLNAAENWLRAGQLESARLLLDQHGPARLDGENLVRWQLARAELALLDGDLAMAGWLLAETEAALPERQRLRFEMLEDLLREARENPAREALRALNSAVHEPDFSPEIALALLIELPHSELEALLEQHGHRPEIAPWLDLAASARAVLLDDPALTRALNEWEERHPAAGYSAEQAEMWLALWRQTRDWPRRIAVMLPGEGALARAGSAIRDGLVSAWLELPPARRPALEFIYLDDRPGAATSAWFEARERNADFLLGPLDRDRVEELAELPDSVLPSLAFNIPRPEALAETFRGPQYFFGLPPEGEAELAAVRAWIDGHRRALVLTQSSGWGERVAAAFSETFTLSGGEIVGSAEYSPEQADHSTLLEVLLDLDHSARRIRDLAATLGRQVEAEPHRRTDADFVFLGARETDGRQIRPQLRFFGAGDLPVYATSQIIAGAPQAARDEDLDGVALPMPPWFLDRTAEGQQRLRAEGLYRHLSNPTLSRLHALGFDALGLVPWLDAMRADPALYMAGLHGRLRLVGGNVIERDLPFIRLVDGQPEALP